MRADTRPQPLPADLPPCPQPPKHGGQRPDSSAKQRRAQSEAVRQQSIDRPARLPETDRQRNALTAAPLSRRPPTTPDRMSQPLLALAGARPTRSTTRFVPGAATRFQSATRVDPGPSRQLQRARIGGAARPGSAQPLTDTSGLSTRLAPRRRRDRHRTPACADPTTSGRRGYLAVGCRSARSRTSSGRPRVRYWCGRAPTARRSRGRAQPLSQAEGEPPGPRARPSSAWSCICILTSACARSNTSS